MILFFIVGFNIKDRKCFVLATVLDPRFKTKFLSDENKAKQWIIDELLAMNNTVSEDYENNIVIMKTFKNKILSVKRTMTSGSASMT